MSLESSISFFLYAVDHILFFSNKPVPLRLAKISSSVSQQKLLGCELFYFLMLLLIFLMLLFLFKNVIFSFSLIWGYQAPVCPVQILVQLFLFSFHNEKTEQDTWFKTWPNKNQIKTPPQHFAKDEAAFPKEGRKGKIPGFPSRQHKPQSKLRPEGSGRAQGSEPGTRRVGKIWAGNLDKLEENSLGWGSVGSLET